MQPVQDLTIEDRVSRTQFQFTLEDPDASRLGEWVPQLVERLQQAARSSPTSPATCRTSGLQAFVDIDRDAASRLGVTRRGHRRRALRRVRPAADLDDLHAGQPVPRGARGGAAFQLGPEALGQIYVRAPPTARAGAARRNDRDASRIATRAAGHQSRRAVSGRDDVVQPGARVRRSARRSRRSSRRERELGDAGEHPDDVPGRGRAFRASLDSTLS